MSDGKAKVTLLLELKNRLRGGMATAKKFISDNVQEMKNKLNSLKEKHIEAFSAMREQIPLFGRAMEILGNPFAKIIIGLTALIAVYGKASAMASNWDGSMAKANVTANLSTPQLKALSDQILEIGARNATDLMQVPVAFNKIISAGLDVKTSLDTLEPTLRAAKAGFTDVETTAKAAVSVMNSSGIMDANRVYDILFATLNKGNAEFSDIAQYLPKIIPMARQAGISLEEVAGAYAYLTAQGMSAEQSATGLQNVFKSLSDQQIIFGTNTKKGLKGLGIQVFDATGKMKPMLDIITQLKDKMQGLSDAQKVTFLDQIGFDMESGTAIASMTQDTAKLKEIIDFTTNSTGQLDQAMINAKTNGDSWVIMGNQLKKAMIEIGQPVNETFGKLGEELLPMVQSGLVYVKDIFTGIWSIISEIVKLAWTILEPILQAIGGIVEFIKQTGILQTAFSILKGIISVIAEMVKLIVEGLKWLADRWKSPSTIIKEEVEKHKRKTEATDFEISQQDAIKNGKIIETPLMPSGGVNKPSGFDASSFKNTKTPGSGTSVSGKAEQVRNITINIGNAFNVDKMNVAGDDGKVMKKEEFEKWAKEMFMRMMRNFENSYS